MTRVWERVITDGTLEGGLGEVDTTHGLTLPSLVAALASLAGDGGTLHGWSFTHGTSNTWGHTDTFMSCGRLNKVSHQGYEAHLELLFPGKADLWGAAIIPHEIGMNNWGPARRAGWRGLEPPLTTRIAQLVTAP